MSIPMEPLIAAPTNTIHPHQDMLDKTMAYYYAEDYRECSCLL